MSLKTVVILTLIAVLLTSCGATPTPTGTAEVTAAVAVTTAPNRGEIILATATSTQDSGLLDVLVPDFQAKTGYTAKVIAVGSGAALEMAKKGDADVVLAHAPSSEKELLDAGEVLDRRLVMHNDFVIVGPSDDPAAIKGSDSSVQAMKLIAESQSVFISRGDDSGTHKKELTLWQAAGIGPQGAWYQESGQGMGATLSIASEKGGYTLTDRATYLAQRDNLDLVILVEGDKSLLNIYHVMMVNPDQHPAVNAEGAKAFLDYMTSAETQQLIGEFGLKDYGQPLFVPDAGKPEG